MRFEELRPEQYRARLAEAPIAYLAWGAHEWHGLHNPLGLDTLKCHGQALALCAETGGIVFPPIYCGYQTMKPHAGFKGTLEFRVETIQDLARQYLEQLADEGFRLVIIVMGHYGGLHVAAIREVVERFNQERRYVRAWAFPDYEPVLVRGMGGDHAGANETSLMMRLRPELVDLGRLPQDRPLTTRDDGIGGEDPRAHAGVERGDALLRALVEEAAPKIRALLEETLAKP